MTRRTAPEYPALQRALSGYLHEDLFAEYGTPAAALRAFLDDASAAERRRFRVDVQRFLARTENLPCADVRDEIARLGCRWLPPSCEALVELLVHASDPAAPPAGGGNA